MKTLGVALALSLAIGCAPSLPRAYLEARSAAERSYDAGRYDEAAERWLEAAKVAGSPRDQREATYRAAASYTRAGRHEQAAGLYRQLIREAPRSDRAARAAFELALDEIRRGSVDAGYAKLQAFVERYPTSGLAKPAFQRLVAWKMDSGGASAALAWLGGWLPRLDHTEMAEQAHYAYARALEAAGRLPDAKRRFEYVAERFPYPSGALWDDSLWELSLIDEQLGDYRAAIAVLERMLAEQEPSGMNGSYERPRYAPARFRIAVLYRDRLRDAAAARRAFHAVWTHHPTSLLRDDALWNEALLAREAGDEAAACRVLGELGRGMPDSRYVPCAKTLCASMPAPTAERPCRDYVAREARQALGLGGDDEGP